MEDHVDGVEHIDHLGELETKCDGHEVEHIVSGGLYLVRGIPRSPLFVHHLIQISNLGLGL